LSWLKIDDKFVRHPKVMGLSDKAFRLHVAALCSCAEMLTDGYVSEREAKMLAPVVGTTSWKRYVHELIHAGLWLVEPHGWSIKDYLDYNPSALKVKEQRARNAERQRQHRNGVTNGVSNAAPSRPGIENPKLASSGLEIQDMLEPLRKAHRGEARSA